MLGAMWTQGLGGTRGVLETNNKTHGPEYLRIGKPAPQDTAREAEKKRGRSRNHQESLANHILSFPELPSGGTVPVADNKLPNVAHYTSLSIPAGAIATWILFLRARKQTARRESQLCKIP
jgi:hypothetical protein